jgi:hypothetical protein
VDVETVLLCDVLPDGTVAGVALVEPIYDTNTGDRVGTRTVDPATGAAYTVQGELQQCAATSTCPDCQTHILCDLTTVTVPGETPERIINGQFAADDSGWTLGGSARYVPSSSPDGSVGFLDLSPDNQAAGSAEQTTSVTPGLTYNLSARIGIWSTGGTTPQSVLVEVLDGSGAVLHSETIAPADVSGGPLWPADGVVGPVPIVATDTTLTVRFTDQVGGDFIDALLDDVSLLGPGVPGTSTTEAHQFMRHLCRDCQGAVTITDTELDGTTVYAVQGTVGTCPVTEESACESPTTPVTSVGLCLADGTPIAVTVVRDCTGAVASEGWINLSTGAWSAGVVPVGTVACGESRSIQVSGTFCDVDDATGDVLGLVLVEYTYDDTGAIASVRLVDAVTGGTYTPTGTVTVCPAGVEQPERDLVQLCDTATDGTVVQFVRDYARDENGAIVGHSDYTLDGTAYVPAGTVGVCSEPCRTTSLLTLCDTTPSGPIQLASRLSYTDVDPTPFIIPDGVTNLPTLVSGQPFWDGGTVVVAPPAGGEAVEPTHRIMAARIGVEGAAQICNPPANVTLTLTCHIVNEGPVAGQATCGRWHLHNGATIVANQAALSVSVGGFRNMSITGSVPWADLLAGNVHIAMDLETAHFGSKSWTADTFAVTVTPTEVEPCDTSTGETTQFLRAVVTDCATGETVSTTDTSLDGTPYTPVGEVGVCTDREAEAECLDCETLVLCAEDPATITGQGVSSGTLANGVTWQAKGNSTTVSSSVSNADGAWWGNPASFPNVQVPPYTFTFSEPSVVEFSVYMGYISAAAEPDDNCMQLPAGLEVVSLPTGWVYNAATGLACVTGVQPADPTGANLANPTRAVSARFRTPGPVSTLTTLFLGPRRAVNGAFRTSWVGALQVTPTVQFLRRICRDCEGMVTSTTDTLLDGTTAYAPPATVKVCQPTQDQPEGADAEPLLLCHTAPDGTVTPFLRHIVYNASTGAVSRVTDTLLNGMTLFNGGAGTVGQCNDDCCKPVQVCIQQDPIQSAEFISNEDHRNDNTVDPVWKWTTDLNAVNPPWYDMYQYQYSGAWSVTDSDTERPAWWVSPHPFGASAQSSPAWSNEGPSLLNAHWFPRAYFDLPDNADPATIKVQATVFNADQIGRAFRLNDGAWQTLPATATHNGTTYTFGPDTIPGATAGRNYLYLDVEETVGGGAGLMVHLKVFYEVIPETRSWTRMVCCDGSVYYIDEDGQRQDSVPDGWHVAPCGGSTTDTEGPTPDAVSTGVRSVTGTTVQDLAAEFATLQSVSLAVLEGVVNANMSDGTAVAIPAGVTLTWSVSKDTDSALTAASFAGADPASAFLLNWTYLS